MLLRSVKSRNDQIRVILHVQIRKCITHVPHYGSRDHGFLFTVLLPPQIFQVIVHPAVTLKPFGTAQFRDRRDRIMNDQRFRTVIYHFHRAGSIISRDESPQKIFVNILV